MKVNHSFERIEGTHQIKPQGTSDPTGIKVYNTVGGWLRSCVGISDSFKDANKKTWYVDKASLRDWGKSQGGGENFKLKNLDQLLQQIKAPKKPSSSYAPKKTSPSYTEERIGKELWRRENQRVSKETINKVNLVASYLDKQGFELVGVPSDGNCYFSAFKTSLDSGTRKIPIVTSIDYLRELLSSYVKNKDKERANEIEKDKDFVSATEGDLLAIGLQIPIRVITPMEDSVMDLVTFPDKDKDPQTWETLGDKERPKLGTYILIVDFGGHFVTAEPIPKHTK